MSTGNKLTTPTQLSSIILGSWPNGMKGASERLLDQLLTQFLPGFDHTRAALGPPFLDARFPARRSDRGDDQPSSWDAGARRAEPPQRLQNAQPLPADVVAHG